MKNIKLCVLALLLSSASIIALDIVPARGRISTCYHNTCNKLSNHKGKTALVAGAVGATIVNKVFSFEIDTYVKPFIKNIWHRTCNLFRRIFKKEEKA